MLHFVCKFIQAVTLADIATVDGQSVSHEAFEATASNSLRQERIELPKVPLILPPAFISLRKDAINKSFIDVNSGGHRRIATGLYLSDWLDQEVNDMWGWWSVPCKNRVYRRNNRNWTLYACRFGRLFYYINTAKSCPINQAIPISVRMEAISYVIEVNGPQFNILPVIDTVSDFEDNKGWEDLKDGFNTAVAGKTILLDQY